MKKNLWDLYFKTIPFVALRVAAYLVTAIAMSITIIIFGGTGLLLSVKTGIDMFAILGIGLGIAAPSSVFFLANRYILYLIKTAHLTVMTNYMYTGKLPENQFKYGIEAVKNNFGKTTLFAGLDALISGSVKQVLRLLTKAEGLLSFIPGFEWIFKIINNVISIIANYIDEAILTLLIHRKKENSNTNSWNDAAEGIVLYAQCWKEIGVTATFMAIFLTVANIILFILMSLLVFALPSFNLGFLLRIFMAVIFTWAISNGAITPVVTVAIVSKYHATIENKEVNQEWVNKITNASSKFKEIINRGRGIVTDSLNKDEEIII